MDLKYLGRYMNIKIIENVTLITPVDILRGRGILIKNGKIASVFRMTEKPEIPEAEVFDGENHYALAGMIDLHIHGFGGHGVETGTQKDLLAMSDILAKNAVTAFCPTLYCAKPADMIALIKKLAPAIGKEKGAKIIGFHLEGPFISPKKPGVMKPEDIAPADVELFKKLYEAAEGKIASVTLAPELKNIEPIIDFCREHKILIQAGHTNATYEEFVTGIRQGIRHATHLFNAMSPFTQRAPGAAGAVLMSPEVSCEIIADGVHVHPAIVNFLRTAKPLKNILLVTDALMPTAQEKPPFIANGEEVVFENGVWKRKSDGVIAGSGLTMAQGIKNLVSFGYTLPQAVQCATVNPARLLGLNKKGLLEEEKDADIVLLDKDFTPRATFIAGEKI